MIMKKPPIRIEEYELKDSNKDVKVIAQAAFNTKQYWFGFNKERLNSLNLLELVEEGVKRLDLGRRVGRAYSGLSNFFKDEVRSFYDDFRKYNRRSIKRLNKTITANFGE